MAMPACELIFQALFSLLSREVLPKRRGLHLYLIWLIVAYHHIGFIHDT